ncbi:MAG TPA: thiol reductant ABC exporter subunit CydD, partial [Anaerolineae bacterium]|nr:thiol reductant ABC exporter subunit CydD [Anaerolineae bacterium]
MKLDRRLWQLARSVRFQLGLTIMLGLVLGVLIIAQARALAGIINQVFLQAATLGQVWTALIGLLVIMIARALVYYGSEVSAFRAAARLKTQLRERLLDHLIALG